MTPSWPAGLQTVSPDKGVDQLLELETLDGALWLEGVFSVSEKKGKQEGNKARVGS